MDRTQQMLLCLIPLAYLAGSVPFGLIVGLAKGIDPRTSGSGNIGATNLGRLLGMKYFALVFTLDLLKGLLPMLLAAWVLRGQPERWLTYVLWLGIAAGCIAGHMFSLFIGFKGGKGVATSCGMVLGLWPFYTLPGLVAVGVWIVAFMVSRYVSLASILAAAVFPVAYAAIGLARGWPITGQQAPLLVFAAAVAVMIVYKHRSNIARLRAGTEKQFRGKATQP